LLRVLLAVPSKDKTMQILHNHIGFRPSGPKIVIVQTEDRLYAPEQMYAELIELETETVVHRQEMKNRGRVAGWTGRFFHLFDFSGITQQGRFFVRITSAELQVSGQPFVIDEFSDTDPLLSDIIHYFKGQRCSGRWDETDRHAPFFGGRTGTVDVHGGWYDAAGDYSKYLSHLSYANYFNPQQTPLVVWALFEAGRILENSRRFSESLLAERTLEEAWWGADFLMRMQDQQGYFYMTLFDTWSKESEKRMISAFKTQEGELLPGYEAGFRQGGAMAIAALARASGFPRESVPADGYTPGQCLKAASAGYHHLVEHNREYLDNGRENIIDFYCALSAAVELYQATGERYYLDESRRWFRELRGLFDPELGAWRVEPDGPRPYFHASDTGLLHIALISYAAVEQDEARHEEAVSLVEQALRAELALSERVFNPFSISRQIVQPVGGDITDAFFIAHKNETGYWWQGENARLASVTAGCRAAAVFLTNEGKSELADSLSRYAQAQLDWILGCNPFDICMMQGQGRNNPRYENHYPNAPGGICNGITAGFYDETDIAFLPPGIGEDGRHRWRWSEQWIPHAAWFALAAAMELE
jgi:hypothetical protein